eukprot:Sspe_Gene.85224::Locus_56015_Transcript_1_1_Confidence_1.000_Length_459::g.85224::m.85224
MGGVGENMRTTACLMAVLWSAAGCSTGRSQSYREMTLRIPYGGVEGARFKAATLTTSRRIEVYCWKWLGWDASGPCSQSAADANHITWICQDNTDCEPLRMYVVDGEETIELRALELTSANWTIWFDPHSLPASCFPRRLKMQ